MAGTSRSTSASAPDAAPSITYSLAVCAAFCALSTWCTLYNKYIFVNVSTAFSGMLLAQNCINVVVLLIGRRAGKFDFGTSIGVADLICGMCYGLSVTTGLWSLVFVNIVMFGALKRCTVVTSWAIEYGFARTDTTVKCALPILVMCGGTLLASCNDYQFSAVGYACALASCLFQGSAYELGRRVAVDESKGLTAVLYANSVSAVLLQLVVLACSGDIGSMGLQYLSWEISVHTVLNGVCCLLMSYVIFLNCVVNSPLAHTVTGNMKAVFTTVIGFVMFGSRISGLGWLGIAANFVGAAWFSSIKMQAARAQTDNSRKET
jgi:hypothetical protein